MRISFFVPGVPLPQPRPRARGIRRANNKLGAQMYDPGTTDAWKAMIVLYCKRQMGHGWVWAEAKVEMVFHMPRPKHHFGTNGALKSIAPSRHTLKPDLDNLAKCVVDAITDSGAFWDDDGCVFSLNLSKQYSLDPGVYVVIQSPQP